MIELYTWSTPNGRKISIMLEEIGLPYVVKPVNITEDQQFDTTFLDISPNNKIPAILDTETGMHLMESGAILMYLAKKTDKLLPEDDSSYWSTLEWLMWQMGGAGPMLGQAHHFVHFNPSVSEYSTNRYQTEATRLYRVLDKRLSQSEFVAGEQYSIADIAIWPWIARFQWQGIDLLNFENILRWYTSLSNREGVKRGYIIPNPAEIPDPLR